MEENQQLTEVDEGKAMAILAYILWPIAFFLKKDNQFVLHHLRQGAVLLVGVVGVLALQVLAATVHGFLDSSLKCLAGGLTVGVLVLGVIGVINAAQGTTKKLPFVGQLGDKMPF